MRSGRALAWRLTPVRALSQHLCRHSFLVLHPCTVTLLSIRPHFLLLNFIRSQKVSHVFGEPPSAVQPLVGAHSSNRSPAHFQSLERIMVTFIGFVFKSSMCPVSPTRLQALWPQDSHLRLLVSLTVPDSVPYKEMLNSMFVSALRVSGTVVVFTFIVA